MCFQVDTQAFFICDGATTTFIQIGSAGAGGTHPIAAGDYAADSVDVDAILKVGNAASNPDLAGDEMWFGPGGLIFEGTVDDFEGTLGVGTLSSDKIWILPDLTGTLALIGSPIFTGDPTGPTASGGDSDFSLATTAFHQSELLTEDEVEAFIFDTDTENVSGVWTWNDDVQAKFGTDADAGIYYLSATDKMIIFGPNMLIDAEQQGKVTVVGGLLASASDNEFSRFGDSPTHITDLDLRDRLVATLPRNSLTLSSRTGLFVHEDTDALSGTIDKAGQALNTFAFTTDLSTVDNSVTTNAGGAVGNKSAFTHRGEGTYQLGGGVSAQVKLGGANEDGTIVDGYALHAVGPDGGTSGTAGDGITRAMGLWVRDGESGTNIENYYGIRIDDITALSDSGVEVGIRLDGADDYALWFNNDSGTANDGITFGADATVNLYRSAANILKTDDTFITATDLHSLGGFVGDVETVTGTSATLGADDHIMLIDDDTAGGAVTITLPACASHNGRQYHVKKLGTTGNVTIDGNASETIDGGLTAVLTAQYESVGLVCDSSNWSIF